MTTVESVWASFHRLVEDNTVDLCDAEGGFAEYAEAIEALLPTVEGSSPEARRLKRQLEALLTDVRHAQRATARIRRGTQKVAEAASEAGLGPEG